MGVIAVLAVCLAVVVGVFTLFITSLLMFPMLYAGSIEWAVHSASGLQTHITRLAIDLFPVELTLGGVTLSNPQLQHNPTLVTLEQLTATVDPRRYLQAEPTWWAAEATGISVRLANDAQGRSIWQTASATSDAVANPPEQVASDTSELGSGSNPALAFSSLTVSDLAIERVAGDQSYRLHVVDLALAKIGDERLKIGLTGTYQDQPLTARGTLALPSSERAQDVDFRASILGGELTIDGVVGHNGITPGEAHVRLTIPDLSAMGRLLDQNLNGYAPVSLSGTLKAPRQGRWLAALEGNVAATPVKLDIAADTDGPVYMLKTLALKIGDSTMTAQGYLDTAKKTAGTDIVAQRLDIDQLLAFARPEKSPDERADATPDLQWLELWSVEADADIVALMIQGYEISDVSLHLNNEAAKLHASASLESMKKAAAADDSAAAAWAVVQPVEASVTVNPPAAKGANNWSVTAELASAGMQAELEATFAMQDSTRSQAKLTATIKNFSAIDGIDTSRMQPLLPLTLAVTGTRPQPSSIVFDPITLTVEDSHINGRLEIDRTSTPVSVKGKLHSNKLDINHFATTSNSALADTGDAIDQPSTEVIGDKPMDWGWLNDASAHVSLTLDEFIFNTSDFRNLKTELAWQDGRLDIDPISADLSKGGVRGHVQLQKVDSGATIDVRLIATELTPADLGEKNAGLIDGGETDLLVNFTARGATPQELASSLNGEFALEVQHATIRNSLFDIIGSDIVTQTVSLINPFTKRDDTTELECAAAYFQAVDGVLTSPDQLVIETSKMKIRGGGAVNLNDESLQIDFVPTARSGLGISLGSLAGVVRLGGTLGRPSPVADPKGIFKAGATIGAAIATGGISMLAQGLFDRARNVGTACGKIFENVPATDVPGAISTSDPDESAAPKD